ncbi:hypothetical protein INT45_005836 [Circinella minor]|uniref:Uncharacterized protein n=1 Tax=Circinella minor TaxID=1195481 RepID=A0A8H7RYQ8_9FUNG|nr:hypothetical protein INT45_005836 [Circinella minor]
MLHQTSHTSNVINKKKITKVSKLLPEERIILKEFDLWEVKVHQLKQAKRYIQKGEEVELKKHIQYWRSACQDIAMALVPAVLQDQQQSSLLSWGYDDGYECDSSSLEEQASFYNDDLYHGVQKNMKNEQEKENDDDTHDMTLLLSKLRIDPQLIHYSIETGEFYD